MKKKKPTCQEEVDLLSSNNGTPDIRKCERLRGHKGRHRIQIEAIRYANDKRVEGVYFWGNT